MDDDARLGQRVRFAGAEPPAKTTLPGRWSRLEPLDCSVHADDLWAGANQPGADRTWDYVTKGPFDNRSDFDEWLQSAERSADPLFFTLIDAENDRAKGVASYLRMDPPNGVIEIGHIWMSPELQRTRAATDAIFTMMEHAFDGLGNRRLEWKCNALNAPSRRAAERYGFRFEGVFRQHLIIKGHSRDTAWYAILDGEWEAIAAAIRAWLEPRNFDSEGRQRKRLAAFMEERPE